MHLDTLARDSTFLKQKLDLDIDTGFVRWLPLFQRHTSCHIIFIYLFTEVFGKLRKNLSKAKNLFRREGSGGRTGHNRLNIFYNILQNNGIKRYELIMT